MCAPRTRNEPWKAQQRKAPQGVSPATPCPRGRSSLTPVRSAPEGMLPKEGTRDAPRDTQQMIPERTAWQRTRCNAIPWKTPGRVTPRGDTRGGQVRSGAPRLELRAGELPRCGPKAAPEGGFPKESSASSQQTLSRQRGSGPDPSKQNQRGHGVTTATTSSVYRIGVASTVEAPLPAVPLGGPGVAPRADRRDGWSREYGNRRLGVSKHPFGRRRYPASEHGANTAVIRRDRASRPLCHGELRNLTVWTAWLVPARDPKIVRWNRCSPQPRSLDGVSQSRHHSAGVSANGRVHSQILPPGNICLEGPGWRVASGGAERCAWSSSSCCRVATSAHSPRHVGQWALGMTSRRSTRVRALSTRTSSRNREPLDESSDSLPPDCDPCARDGRAR